MRIDRLAAGLLLLAPALASAQEGPPREARTLRQPDLVEVVTLDPSIRLDVRYARRAMEREGFFVYSHEWWHFDYRDWLDYPILDLSFAEIDAAPPRAVPAPQRSADPR